MFKILDQPFEYRAKVTARWSTRQQTIRKLTNFCKQHCGTNLKDWAITFNVGGDDAVVVNVYTRNCEHHTLITVVWC